MPQNLTDGKSTLVQVMAWSRQATSHYLSQRLLSSLSPYGIARPRVNSSWHGDVYVFASENYVIIGLDNDWSWFWQQRIILTNVDLNC